MCLFNFLFCQQLFADWPRHRGDAALNGRTNAELGTKLDLLWSYETGEFLKSSVVVEQGIAFVGSDDGLLHAIELETGKKKWTFKTEMAIEAPPLTLWRSSDCWFDGWLSVFDWSEIR